MVPRNEGQKKTPVPGHPGAGVVKLLKDGYFGFAGAPGAWPCVWLAKS